MAVGADGQVLLSWEASEWTDGYEVKRSTDDGGPYALLAWDVMQTNHTDHGVIGGQTYYYVVSAVNSIGTVLSLSP